ncbi:hypothetical protein [uncultured Jannaschia sp.]|uniref:hypothetical protein n=1 Tax=uncultured Jannaschia sp. TaxID=293347 RepID=UPI00261AA372|nr:hypothetical protein [uncultured Jannaschia sp.]
MLERRSCRPLRPDVTSFDDLFSNLLQTGSLGIMQLRSAGFSLKRVGALYQIMREM